MRRLPPEPQVGDRITAELVRELIRCIRERQLLKGPNYTLQTGPNGTYLKIDPPKAAGGASPSPLPWSFACTIDEGGEGEDETRTGGWTNCRLQLGLDLDWHSPDLDPDHSPPDPNSPGYDSEQADDWYKRNHVIKGCDTTDDGAHYIWIVLADGSEGRELDSVEIKTNGGDVTDLLSGKIRIELGTVADGKIGLTPHLNPCVYKYL